MGCVCVCEEMEETESRQWEKAICPKCLQVKSRKEIGWELEWEDISRARFLITGETVAC